MSKFYVINCTNQIFDLCYRLPEKDKLCRMLVGIGQQIQISGNLSVPEVESLVQQLSIYGAICADEIDRTKPYIGLCYSLDYKVNIDRIRYGFEHNVGVLDELGREIRKSAALATMAWTDNQMRKTGIPGHLRAV